MEAVSDILQSRMREPGGLLQTSLVSLAGHAVVLALLLLIPAGWVAKKDVSPALVMTISLGGAPGPQAGGMTMIGGRPVQAPPPEAQPEKRAAPAATVRQPAMVLPVPDSKVRPRPQPKPAAASQPGGRTASDVEARAGSARAETGAQGMGFGLSTGGGGTGGYLDVGNFCCPEYLNTMVQLIQRNWNAKQEVTGDVLMKFVIQRDGGIHSVEVERSSGYAALDLSAQRSLVATHLPALPTAFPDDRLTVHLRFQYQR